MSTDRTQTRSVAVHRNNGHWGEEGRADGGWEEATWSSKAAVPTLWV